MNIYKIVNRKLSEEDKDSKKKTQIQSKLFLKSFQQKNLFGLTQ